MGDYEIIKIEGSGNYLDLEKISGKYSFLFFGEEIYIQTGIKTMKEAIKELEKIAYAYCRKKGDKGIGEIRKRINDEETILLKKYNIYYSKEFKFKERR